MIALMNILIALKGIRVTIVTVIFYFVYSVAFITICLVSLLSI